jgi:hypothetical protein
LRRQLEEQRTLANLQREEDAIAREKLKLEKEALARVNGNLQKQVLTFRRADQRNSGGIPAPPPSQSKGTNVSRPGSKVVIPPGSNPNGDGDQPSYHSPGTDLRDYLREKEARARHFKEFEDMMRKESGEPQPSAVISPVVRSRLATSPLSEEILTCPFPKKFSPPTFDRYAGKTDPIQHLRHFQEKMDMYSHDDRIMCRVFPSSLKDVASNWFYSLRPNSLHTFDEVSRAFVDQYISRKEIMKNSYTLLSLKMGSGESLKNYLSRFQNEVATIHNCSDEVAAAAFIGGLPPTHKFFEVLVEHGVTQMSEVVRRAQGLIQVEETKRSALNVANKSSNGGDDIQKTLR